MKKLWRQYFSTILSLVFLIGAVIYGWYDTQQQQTVLGALDETNFESAVVQRVIDGDTIKLTDGRTVRYIGIDTPELNSSQSEAECFAQQALEYNRELIEGQTVLLEKDVSETDRYGRSLRYVWLDDTLVNLQLVLDGYAQVSTYPPDVRYQEDFRTAEQAAQYANRGLWSSCVD